MAKKHEYIDPTSLPSLEEVVVKWCDSAAFAEIKSTTGDAVRNAARRGDLDVAKLYGTLLFKRPEFSEKNTAWVAGERVSTRTREDGRRRYEMYALDEEITGIQEAFPDVEVIDLRARNKARNAAKKAKTTTEGPAPEAVIEPEDELDTADPTSEGPAVNPFAQL